MMTNAGKEMQVKYDLPDFTELVHKKFTEKLPTVLTDWPEVVVEPGAVKDDYQNSSECLLTIRSIVIVSNGAGLQTHTMGQLVNSGQNILWKKKVSYKSSDLNRPCKFDELEADNGKALNEEIIFAVEKTTSELIDHLKSGTEVKETDSTEQYKVE
jgi:hypothetical protein